MADWSFQSPNPVNMPSSLAVVIDGQKILHYDRNNLLPEVQQQYLDKMDLKMDSGIEYGAEVIPHPDKTQRAQYVANQLVNALKTNDDPLAAATCAYLATRFPELQQVKSSHKNGKTLIELVFDRSFEQASREKPISFKPH